MVVDVISEPVNSRGTIELMSEIKYKLPSVWQQKSAMRVGQEISRERVAA